MRVGKTTRNTSSRAVEYCSSVCPLRGERAIQAREGAPRSRRGKFRRPTSPGLCGRPIRARRELAMGQIVQPIESSLVAGNEYTTWVERDPHAIAYSVLFGDRAQPNREKPCLRVRWQRSCRPVMVRALRGFRPLASSRSAAAQLAWTPNRRADGGRLRKSASGRARAWIDLHTASTWKDQPAAEKQRFGMNDVKNSAAMAQECAGCHVARRRTPNDDTPLQDVNHDMLAAGHPRLDFEFASFMANIPAHWKQTSADVQRRESARPWADGQLASPRAELDAIGRSGTPAWRNQGRIRAPWPEFAEYDCSSCHS